ncbi:carbohydrate binding domain-containing protein [Hirsutella rhossiliensis]
MRSALAAALGLALVPLSQAWNVELPPCLDDFKPFVSSGCFREGSDPTLIFRSGLDQHNMTVEKCVADCKGNGYRYAGLEYYGVCFCGSTVNGPQVPDSQCSLPCSGNKSETCGGDKALSVWQDPTFPKTPEDVTVDDYKSLGCFTDDSTKGRTLSWPVKADASSFTTKKCLAACEKGGFPFAGTEYGGECWCGVVLANDTAKVHESECNMPCRGDASDKCGGRARLSLYVAKDLESLEPCGQRPVTTSSSIATATKPLYKFPNTTTPALTKPRETASTVDQPSNTTSQPGETTSSKPIETVTSAPEETASTPSQGATLTKPQETTSNSPGESTASTKPDESSTSAGQTPTPSETTATSPEESSTTKPGETTKADETTTNPGETTMTGPGKTLSSTPYGSTSNEPSESTATSTPGETTPASSSEPGSSTATAPGKETTASSITPSESSKTTEPVETTPETKAPSSSPGETSTPSWTSVTTSDKETATSSSNAGEPTSSTQSRGTTSTIESGETSTPTSGNSGKTTASSGKPGESTSPTQAPTTTTKNEVASTTALLCTATSIVPSRCEWQRGNWCAPPLPDWNSRHGCVIAAKTCALQVVSCFKYAGWPHTIDCFDFQRWCRNVQRYCAGSCRGRGRCGKGDCWSKYKPGFGKPPATTTSVFPCLPASATDKPTPARPATSCPPAPTNICKQPTNDRWGYGPGKPVGGIPLPVVGCNDIKDDWRSRPYKLYTEPDSVKSPSFRWPERPNVCVDSCREQYQHCRDTYVDSCRQLGWKGGFHKRREGETDAEFARRAQPWSGTWAVESEAADANSSSNDGYCAATEDHYSWARHGSDSVNCWGWGGNTPDKAEQRCRAQYNDCLAVNSRVNPGDQCKTWCRNY